MKFNSEKGAIPILYRHSILYKFYGNPIITTARIVFSYNKVKVLGTAAGRDYFHLVAEAVRMGE